MISSRPQRPISRQLRFQIVTQPSVEPIVQADYQQYLRINATLDATLVANKVAAARVLCEQYTRRAFITQTWDLFMDSPPGAAGVGPFPFLFYGSNETPTVELPKGMLQTVTGVYLTDNSGTETTVDPSVYWVSGFKDPGRLSLRQTQIWPSTSGRTFETFRVRFTCGYGDTSTTVPAAIRRAILAAAALDIAPDKKGKSKYDAAEAGLLPDLARELLQPYRLLSI